MKAEGKCDCSMNMHQSVATRGGELYIIKYNTGTRTNIYDLAINSFRLAIKIRFLTIKVGSGTVVPEVYWVQNQTNYLLNGGPLV